MFITFIIVLTIDCVGLTFYAFKKGRDVQNETVNDSYSLYQIRSIVCVKAMLILQAISNIELLAMIGYFQYKLSDDQVQVNKLLAV